MRVGAERRRSIGSVGLGYDGGRRNGCLALAAYTGVCVTSPTGRVFVSYRRSRRDDVAMLSQALRDVGVPTWQDVDDLRHEPTEDAVRRCIRDTSTAGAVLYLTPEVSTSSFIRDIEIPEILRRHGRDDGFWFLPVVGGGLSYSEASAVLDGTVAADELARWNLLSADDPFSAVSAARVAASALRERVVAVVSQLDQQAPLHMRLDVRDNSSRADDALALDWRPHFSPHAVTGDWEATMLPALDVVRRTLRDHARGRELVVAGTPSLPAAFALGHAVPELLPLTVRWLQRSPGGTEQSWSLADAPDSDIARKRGWTVSKSGYDIDGKHLAVLVNVVNSTESRFAASRALLPPLRAKIVVDHADALAVPPDERPDSIRIRDGSEAASLARLVRRAVRNALDSYGPLDAVHVFLAGPAGLAVLIGQLANAFPALVTYDALDATGRYAPAATLLPRR